MPSSLLPKKYIWVKELYLDSLALDTLDLRKLAKLDTLRSITLGSFVDGKTLEVLGDSVSNKLIVSTESHCKEEIGKYVLSCKRVPRDTLVVGDTARDERQGRIKGDSGFADDPQGRGHRLQRWVVEAASGSSVIVRAESDSLDAVLYVVLGDSVLYSDDDGPGTNSFLEFQMPDSGHVDVLAGSYWTDAEGEYSVRVGRPADLPVDERSDTLVVGDKAGDEGQGTITGDSGFVGVHRLQRWVVKAGRDVSVIVRAESDDFDAVLYVDFGDSVLYSDDDGPGTNSFVEFQMPDSGRVDVLAGSYLTDAEGEYSVRVGQPADLLVDERSEPRDTLVVGDMAGDERQSTITGDSSFVDPIRGHRLQRWVVEAAPGSSVMVRAESDAFDAVLYVLGDRLLYSDDDGPGTDSFLEFQMPDSGRVGVLAGSYRADEEGGYRLRVDRPVDLVERSEPRGTLVVGDMAGDERQSTITGDSSFVDPIRGHRLQRWVVEAAPGSSVMVRAESDAFDAVLYVLGDRLLYSDDDGPGTTRFLEFQMPDSGRVDILVGSHRVDAEGEYSVHVDRPDRLLLRAAGDSSVRTLDLTAGAGSDTARISGDAGFVDPIRGHRLQRWAVKADSTIRGVTVLADPDSFDAVLYVVLGDSVLYSDGAGPGANSFAEFQMPDSGRVDVLAGSYRTDAEGRYSVRVGVGGRAHLLRGAAGNSSASTLELTGGVGSDSSNISGDAGFVDPIRGHRLQRWVVEAGQDSSVIVLAESNDFDAVLYVVLGDSVLYSDDDGPGTNSVLEFQMPDSGRVDVLAGSYWTDAEGEYSVRVGVGGRARFLLGAAGNSSVRTLDLTGGVGGDSSNISGGTGFVDPIRGHRLQRWVVEAGQDSSVMVLAESNDFDAVLYVVLGDSVLYSDDDGPGTNSVLEFQMPDSGRVDVLAGSYRADAEGEYSVWVGVGGRARFLLGAAGDSSVRTLDLTGGEGSDTARISGDAGFIDPIRGHWLQRWVVEADSDIRGSRVTVLAESDSFDAVLYVVLGDSVLYSDADGRGTNSVIEFQMPDSGRVNVLAGSSTVAEGEYRLRVAPVGSG